MIELCTFMLAMTAILAGVSVKLWIDHRKCYVRLARVEARLAAIEIRYGVE